VEIEIHAFLTSALDGGEWSASHSSHFTHRVRAHIHWIGGWVGSRTGQDVVVVIKKIPSLPLPVTEP